MRTLVGLLVVVLCACNRDSLEVPPGADAQAPLDLGVPLDLTVPVDFGLDLPPRDLYGAPDLLGPVPPLRFAPPLFQGGKTEGRSHGSALGDFDNDGRIDVATVAEWDLAVALQRPGGWMTPVDTHPTVFAREALFPALADFDGDGRLDAALGGEGGTLVVLFGRGDGTFREGRWMSAGMRLDALTTGDLDRDGKPDLVALGDTGVLVLRGKGDGTFQAGVTYKLAVRDALVVADITGDGHPDIAATNPGGVTLLAGVGDGTFQAAIIRTGFAPSDLAAADFDGDGRVDLMAVAEPNVTPLMSTKQGLVVGADLPLQGRKAGHVVTGDWNSDGKPDVAVAAGTVIPFLGDGKGGFAPGNEVVPRGCAWGGSMLAADLDGDRDLDLVTGNGLLSNDGTGRFSNAPPPSTCPPWTTVPLAADVDEDGLPDIVAWTTLDGSRFLTVLAAAGGGRYRVGPFTAIPPSSTFSAGRIDGDAHLDVVGIGKDHIVCLPGKGDGSFGAPVTSPARVWLNLHGPPVLADFNGDGWLDLVVADGLSLFFALGDSQCGFRALPSPPMSSRLATPIVGDWNDDGQLDVAAANASQVMMFFNQGHGAFVAPQVVFTGQPSGLVAADFDSDGLLDLAVSQGNGSVSMLRRLPGGGFAPAIDSALGQQVSFGLLFAADLNGDLRPDVAASGPETHFVAAGNGDGTFQPPLLLPPVADLLSISMSVVDVDGDGDLDLIHNNLEGPWLTTYLNQTR